MGRFVVYYTAVVWPMRDLFDPCERPAIKCGCADADVEPVKCGEILRKVSVDVMSKVRVGLGLGSDLGLWSGIRLVLG